MPRRRPEPWLVVAVVIAVGVGSACAPDSRAPAPRVAGYATVHDTMPEAIHRAKHEAVERPAAEVARSRSLEATGSVLRRIPDSKDAWLDLTLARRTDERFAHQADTITLLMNCNADSLVVQQSDGAGLHDRLVLQPGGRIAFGPATPRIRIYGLRPVRAGQRSETLVRMALGGDLVVRTPVTN